MPFASDEGVILSELLLDGLEYDEAAEDPQLERAGCFRFGIGTEMLEDDMMVLLRCDLVGLRMLRD